MLGAESLIIKHVMYTKLLTDISFQVNKKKIPCESCKTIPFYTHGPSLLCAEFVMGQDCYWASLLWAELSRNRLLLRVYFFSPSFSLVLLLTEQKELH